MTKGLIIPAREFPIIELNVPGMLLPKIADLVDLRDHPELLVEARQETLPYVVLAMRGSFDNDFPAGLYRVGVVANIMTASIDDSAVLMEGGYRVNIDSIRRAIPGPNYWLATIGDEIVDNEDNKDAFMEEGGQIKVSPGFEKKMRGLLYHIKRKIGILVEECTDYADLNIERLAFLYDNFDNLKLDHRDVIDELIWNLVYSVPQIDSEFKQHFIETRSVRRRLTACLPLLEINIDTIINAKSFEANTQKLIAKYMGSGNARHRNKPRNGSSDSSDDNPYDPSNPELSTRWERYKKIKDTLSEDATKAIIEDFEHLKNNQPGQAEWNIFINHLDCLLDIYSAVITPQENNFSKTEKILGESHYGLDGPKERIYNYLAVKILNSKGKAPILCLVGPPGVGKTSIAKSVAESLGLKFIRLSLGGVRDEADVRGHRQTYIGAIPGKIIQEIRRAGVKNPVFLLDEVDKLTKDAHGDPSSALLEVLDPEQNHSFQDHYVGAPFDLSGVLFICTANLESGIQPALHDRMSIVNISGYTELEKIEIAKKYLIPKQLNEVGLIGKGISLRWEDNNPDKIIAKIISGYTREAGVRELERQIHRILSSWGRRYLNEVDDKKQVELLLTEELVEKFLKTPLYLHERAEATDIGEAIGLAWTPVGGDIMYIQAELTPFIRGDKSISQTGGLQEVFMQMNKNALTVVKNLLKDDPVAMDRLRNNLLHLSSPDGAIPKDGPSAGITMAIAMYSELKQIPVKPLVAWTGELTIKGRIRAVGGIKSKILAAHRDGIKEIVLPRTNKRDIDEKVSEDVKKDLIFHFVSHMKEAIPIAFPENNPTNQTPNLP